MSPRAAIVRTVKDSQIIVRATETEIERWYRAARKVAAQGRHRVSLSSEVRKLLNAWADKVLGKDGAQ